MTIHSALNTAPKRIRSLRRGRAMASALNAAIHTRLYSQTTISAFSAVMPKFDNKNTGKSVKVASGGRVQIPQINEPRCKVCQSPHRSLIDQMLVAGLTYSEIERQFAFAQIPRRSISAHKDKHLGYEEAAIREVIEREAAAAQRNYEEGVGRLVTNNAYLEVAKQKAYDALIRDDVIVEPKDAVKIIEQLERLQERNQDVALDELRVQFQMFMQSVKELVERERWESIVGRTADLLRATGREVDFGSGKDEAEKTPAQVVAEITTRAEVVDAQVVA